MIERRVDEVANRLHGYVHDLQVQLKDPHFAPTRICLHSDIDELADLARKLAKKRGGRPRKFTTVKAGEWVSPSRKGYWMKCCDCELVHFMRFRLVPNERGHGRKIQFQAFRGDGK